MNLLKAFEITVDFRRSPPTPLPHDILNNTLFGVDTFRFPGSTVSQDQKWTSYVDTCLKNAPAEVILPMTAHETEMAPGAADHLLHCHCPLHFHNSLVWIDHQTGQELTATDNHVSREDNQERPAHSVVNPNNTHIQSV